MPYTRPNGLKTIPFTRPNGLKTIPSPVAHSRIANIWEYFPPPWAFSRVTRCASQNQMTEMPQHLPLGHDMIVKCL